MGTLITGATGFVGTNLLQRLNGTDEIIQLVRLNQDENSKVTFENYWSDHSIKAKYYIHLAGKAHDLKNTSDESEYFKVNYELTKRLFDRFLKDERAQTFIFISSVKAVADEVQGELSEDHKPDPVTPYGKSKLKAEEYIIDNLPENRNVVILRPCMIHGPGNKGNLNLLNALVSRGIPWPLGAFDNRRSFLSIDNLIYVIKEILDGKVSTGVYNVADDESFSTSELVSVISEVNGKKARILNIPKSLIKAVAKAGNYAPLPLNEERLQKLTENYLVSNKKIKSALNIENMPVSAKEGMIKTLKSFD